MPTLRAEQIKKTKTTIRVYIYDTGGVYRRLSTAKNAGKQLSRRIFLRHRLLQAPGEEITKRRKKMNFRWYLGKIEKQRISEMFCS